MAQVEFKTIGQRTTEFLNEAKDKERKEGVLRRVVLATVYTGKAYVLDGAEDTLVGDDPYSELLFHSKTTYQRRSIATTWVTSGWVKWERAVSSSSPEYISYCSGKLKEIELNRAIRSGEQEAVLFDARGRVGR